MNTTYTRKQVEVILEALIDDLIKSSNKAYEEIDSVGSLVSVDDGWEIEFSMWLLARKVGGGIDRQQPPIGMKTLKFHITASTKTDLYNEAEDLIAGEFIPVEGKAL